ncbi:MAG: carbohydrate ABC transporter permease [Candidatus Izemoplasmatales bacterium]|nr:carbohydrate ABC transporter permease [Candidatus Izemoplasmatales bacterium]
MTRSRVNLFLQKTFVYTILITMALLIIFIFYTLLVNASRTHVDIQKGFSAFFGNYFGKNLENLLANNNINVLNAMKNSFIIATATAFLSTYVSALTAYSIHLYRFKGRNFLFMFILAVMMIPSQIASVGLITILYSIGFVVNYFVLIVPAMAAPATFFFLKQYLDTILNFELVEAARVDGAGEIRIFHTIVMPLIKPALAIQFIFSFVASWNNFFFPSLIIQSPNKRTIPIVISLLKNSSPDSFDLGPVYMLMVLSIFPMIIVFIIFSKQIIKGITLGSVKG